MSISFRRLYGLVRPNADARTLALTGERMMYARVARLVFGVVVVVVVVVAGWLVDCLMLFWWA